MNIKLVLQEILFPELEVYIHNSQISCAHFVKSFLTVEMYFKSILCLIFISVVLCYADDCLQSVATNSDIWATEYDKVGFRELETLVAPSTLSKDQLKRANKSSSWITNYMEYYPMDHQNYLDYTEDVKIISYVPDLMEKLSYLVFNWTYVIKRELNDRFIVIPDHNNGRFDGPQTIMKNINYKYQTDRKFKYNYLPDKNGNILDQHMDISFIKPTIALDLRDIYKRFYVLFYPSNKRYKVTYFDKKYLIMRTENGMGSKFHYTSYLMLINKKRMVIYNRSLSNCEIFKTLDLNHIYDYSHLDKYFEEVKLNLSISMKPCQICICPQINCPKTICPKTDCPETFCPNIECPPNNNNFINGETTTKQTVTQRHLNQQTNVSFVRKNGSKTELKAKVPKNNNVPNNSDIKEDNIQIINENRFNNESFQIQAAKHGVSFNKLANVLLFEDIWIHVIRFEFPLIDFSPKIETQNYCEKFLDQVKLVNDTSTLTFKNSFKTICDTFEMNLLTFAKNIKTTAESSVTDFKDRQLKRNKRFIVESLIIVGIGSYVLATGAAIGKLFYDVQNTKHDVLMLNNKVKYLEKQTEALKEHNFMLSENLIGFSKRVDSLSRSFDNKLEILKMFMLNQTEQLELTFNKTLTIIEQTHWVNSIISTFNSYRLTQNIFLENQLNLLLNSIQNFENVFESLRNNRLPHSLINLQMLTKILDSIKVEVGNKFDIAIDPINYHLFYSLPLTSFIIKQRTNQIYITMKIPLKRPNSNVLFEAIKVKYNPIPCLNKTCSKHKNLDLENNLISIHSNDNLWLSNVQNGDFNYEVSPGTLSCQVTNDIDICVIYRSNRLSLPTDCNLAIRNWNENGIIQFCDFRIKSKREYEPIQIDYNKYILHQSVYPDFKEMCGNKQSIHKLKSWAEVIETKIGCDIYLSDNKITYGPLSKPLKSESFLDLKELGSNLLEIIQSDENNTNFEFDDLPLPSLDNPIIKRFNISESAIHMEWDNIQLTEFSKYVYKMNLDISDYLLKLDKAFTESNFFNNYNEIVNNVVTFMQIIVTFIILFGIYSHSNLIKPTVLIISPRRADAFNLSIIDPGQFYKITEFYIDILIILLLIIIVILVIKLIWFRQNRISSHFGRGEPRNIENNISYTLILNMHFSRNKFCVITNESIFIRIPVTVLRKGPIKDIKLMTALTFWYTSEIEGKLYLRTAEPIHLYSIDTNGDRLEDGWENIKFSIDNIKWYYLPKPSAFDDKNNYGLCLTSISKDIGSLL